MWGTTSDTAYLDYVYYNSDISIGEAVEQTAVTWDTFGNGFWYGEEQNYYYAYDAAQSGIITDNQTSYLATTMAGPGMVSFYWSVSSDSNDYLEFWLDYKLKKKISGMFMYPPWSNETYLLYPGSHSLIWCYIKDASVSQGYDCGWVDKVVWTPAPSLAEALDNTSLTWYVAGDINFMGQTLTSYYDSDAAISGNIIDNQTSMLFTPVSGPGTVTFYWKVSCELYWDYLGFWIDGTYMANISGEVDWEQRSIHVGRGSHYLVWSYVKDNSFSDYQDCGWVDKVEWTPSATFADPYFLYE
jgi:hypothetical protein